MKIFINLLLCFSAIWCFSGNEFIIAIKSNNVKKVDSLLKNHLANPNVPYIEGVPPLMIATELHFTEIVKKLIEYKVDVNESDNTNHTALHIACKKGFKDIVEVLLKNKADVNRMGFIKKGIYHRERLKPSSYMNFYYTPLYYAALGNHYDICKLLINYGAKVDYIFPENHDRNRYSAIFATYDEKIFKLFVDNGADLNRFYVLGVDHFESGVNRYMYGVYDDENYNNIPYKFRYRTILMKVLLDMARIVSTKWLPNIEYMLQHGANPNLRDNYGRNALYFSNDNIETVKLLLKYGTCVDMYYIKSFANNEYIDKSKKLALIKLLIKKGNLGKKEMEYAKKIQLSLTQTKSATKM